ncbi:transglutaminase TgpA family protein [Paenibacillus aestuarii]|uniref:DUF3488 and DUF4129 domain-containing transglutaminase family protein n=1 Tax=Paenibacillus aestuarii TaxID=516965 RepID=A0ABW0KBL4_9BACL|nr:transglutaminase domain-containing protein [Paenibacillus aestuarii]
MPDKWWKRALLAEWPGRLAAIMTGLLLFQFIWWIQKEDGLWLPETVTVVSGTLLLLMAVQMVPRLHWIWRVILSFILIVGWHALYLNYHFVAVKLHTWMDGIVWLKENFSQIAPFIWFSLVAWAIYAFTMWAVQAKIRIFALIVVSVLFFAIRDSFSVIFLWPQVAGVLFCGFVLLMLRHFAELKQRAPVIWETIIEYPAALAVPILFIVAITLCAGLISPTVDPILTDPYTAWKVSRGEAVPLLGKGISVSTTTADASSGYSRDDSKLGGGFRFDYTPVMTVETTYRTYYRGETRSFYNGKGWELGPAEKKLPLVRVNGAPLQTDPKWNVSLLKTKEVTQSVVMERPDVFPVLFGGFATQQITEINKGENPFQQLLWSPRQAELRFTDKNNYPKDYKLVVQTPILDEPGLREVNTNYAQDPAWSDYLQLPQELPERVKQLAVDITKTGTNNYDKAKLIERYLAEHYPYTNTPDESKGKSKDFVDRFLFEVKQGYCDYYSTSMTVLARSIGLPARWVKGYSSGIAPVPDEIRELGVFSQFGPDIDPNAAGTYTIRNSDAHSWVEIYFDGYGWISFEPTAGFSFPNASPEVTAVPADVTPETAPDEPAMPVDSGTDHTGLWITAAVAGGVVVLAVAAFLLYKVSPWKAWLTRRRQASAVNFNQKIIVEFEKLLRIGRRKGYSRQEHETIREAVARWSQQSKWMKAELDTVLLLFERAKYSQASSTEQDYVQLSQSITRLKEQMK